MILDRHLCWTRTFTFEFNVFFLLDRLVWYFSVSGWDKVILLGINLSLDRNVSTPPAKFEFDPYLINGSVNKYLAG